MTINTVVSSTAMPIVTAATITVPAFRGMPAIPIRPKNMATGRRLGISTINPAFHDINRNAIIAAIITAVEIRDVSCPDIKFSAASAIKTPSPVTRMLVYLP